MPIIFTNQNGDTGASLNTAVQPVVNGDPVDPAATNRPTENLRLRTDLLRYWGDVHSIALAAPVMVYAETTTGGTEANIGWDGPYVPQAQTTVPNTGVDGSGCLWVGEAGSPNHRITLALAHSPAITRYAFAQLPVATGSVDYLIFTTTATAGQGGNSMRVRLVADLAPGATVTATWTTPHISIPEQTHLDDANPAVPAVAMSTLELHLRANGTSTIQNVIDVCAASASPVTGFYINCSVPPWTSAATALTLADYSLDTGYLNLANGVDAARWFVTNADLAAFYDAGKVQNTITTEITSTGSQLVQVQSPLGEIARGTELEVGSGADYEVVTVLSTLPLNDSFEANFSKTHLPNTIIRAAPRRLRAGDALCAKLGNHKERLRRSSNLTFNDLVVVRADAVAQDTTLVPLAVVPYGATRVFFAGNPSFSISAGGRWLSGDTVKLGGDLTGPGSTADTPKVVLANLSSPGLIQLAGDFAVTSTAAAPVIKRAGLSIPGLVQINTTPVGTVAIAAIVDNSAANVTYGEVIAMGLSRGTTTGGEAVHVGTGVLSIGQGEADTSIKLGRGGSQVASMYSQLNFAFAGTTGSPQIDARSDLFESQALAIGTAYAASLHIGRNVADTSIYSTNTILAGTGNQEIRKTATGNGSLKIGTATGSTGALQFMQAGTTKLEITSTLIDAKAQQLTNVAAPRNGAPGALDVPTRTYVDELPQRSNTFTVAQTFSATGGALTLNSASASGIAKTGGGDLTIANGGNTQITLPNAAGSPISFNSRRLSSLADPVDPQDAVTLASSTAARNAVRNPPQTLAITAGTDWTASAGCAAWLTENRTIMLRGRLTAGVTPNVLVGTLPSTFLSWISISSLASVTPPITIYDSSSNVHHVVYLFFQTVGPTDPVSLRLTQYVNNTPYPFSLDDYINLNGIVLMGDPS